MRAFAIWARMTMQADAAIRPESAANGYRSDDAVNREGTHPSEAAKSTCLGE